MAISTPRVMPTQPTEPPSNGAIPPLENGDRLTRAEFERRYEAMPELKKAELIEGEVYMPSPARHRRHSHPHARLLTWLGNYETQESPREANPLELLEFCRPSRNVWASTRRSPRSPRRLKP